MRVALLAPVHAESARFASDYCYETSGDGGDVSADTGKRCGEAAKAIAAAPARDVAADARALMTALGAIEGHCSCIHKPHAKIRHAEGCFVRLHRTEIERLRSLRILLAGEVT